MAERLISKDRMFRFRIADEGATVFLRGSSRRVPLHWSHRAATCHSTWQTCDQKGSFRAHHGGKLAQAQNNSFMNGSYRLIGALDPIKVSVSKKTA